MRLSRGRSACRPRWWRTGQSGATGFGADYVALPGPRPDPGAGSPVPEANDHEAVSVYEFAAATSRVVPGGRVVPGKLWGMSGDDRLAAMLGAWEGDEELSATAWTDAGKARGTVSVKGGPGGGLILDYAEDRAGAIMTGHGVVFGDGWWWFDSYGFTPAAPGTAEWRGDELVLTRRSERGKTVTVLRVRDGRLEQDLDTAVPADAALVPLLRGSYARKGA
jgi:hypothetical protein